MDFVVRTNNVERYRTLGATGRIGWGTIAPVAPLEVNSGGAADAIYGHSTNVGGWLGRETNITFGVFLQNLLGTDLYTNNPTGTRWPLEQVLEQMAVSDDIRHALLGGDNHLADTLGLAVAYDRADWERVELLARKIAFPESRVPEAYRRAVEWVYRILSGG